MMTKVEDHHHWKFAKQNEAESDKSTDEELHGSDSDKEDSDLDGSSDGSNSE